MSKALGEFQDLCRDRDIAICGPIPHVVADLPSDTMFVGLNDFDLSLRPSIHFDNVGVNRAAGFTLRAAHLPDPRSHDLQFLAGPMSDDQMQFAPPYLWIDNAWHRSIDFSPLCGVIALEKFRHTGARRIYMLGMDLYGGDQSKANMHDLRKNAAYIHQVAERDPRIILCEELKAAIYNLLKDEWDS